MKVTIKELRQAIREALTEMKLGIANANPPGEAFGNKNDAEDDKFHTRNTEDLGRLIMTITTDAFDAPKSGLEDQQWHLHHGVENDWDDMGDDDETFGLADAHDDLHGKATRHPKG